MLIPIERWAQVNWDDFVANGFSKEGRRFGYIWLIFSSPPETTRLELLAHVAMHIAT